MSDEIPHDQIVLSEATFEQLVAEMASRSEAGVVYVIGEDIKGAYDTHELFRSWGQVFATLGLAAEAKRMIECRLDSEREELDGQ